jgi:16S rRNA G966 N2-methylase RsmD
MEHVDLELQITRVLLKDDHSSSRMDVSSPVEKSLTEESVESYTSSAGMHAPISFQAEAETAQSDTVHPSLSLNLNNEAVTKPLDSPDAKQEKSSHVHSRHGKDLGEPQLQPKIDTSSSELETIDTAVSKGENTEDPIDNTEPFNACIAVHRHPSAQGEVIFSKTGFVHLPNGDCGDGIVNPHPDSVEDKYWAQRHRLFSRYDLGIKIDREGWFSVTPEAIARHIAQKMTSGKMDLVVLDAFVGVGGNAIAFAQRKEVRLVVCVDKDPEKLYLAANNAKVYGIPTPKLLFVCSDTVAVLQSYKNGKCNKLLQTVQGDTMSVGNSPQSPDERQCGYRFVDATLLPSSIDAIFLSPPWGGSDYINWRHFDLASIHINDNCNGERLLQLAIDCMPKNQMNVAYFLPRNTNGWTLGQIAFSVGLHSMEMEGNYLNQKLKTITAYFISGT